MFKPKEHKPEFDKCFIDADSILYRIAATTDSLAKAKNNFDLSLKGIMRDTGSEKGFVAVKGKGNFRFDIADDYKGNRDSSKMDPKVKEILSGLYEYAWETDCFPSDDCEADDVVAIWAVEAFEAGESFVIAHIDKDIDMCVGWHWNFMKNKLYFVDDYEAHKHLCTQMLTGDSADNIKGIKGVGPKTAEKLLNGAKKEDMFGIVEKAWKEKYPREYHGLMEKCFNLLYMRTSWDQFRYLKFEEVFDAE